jgi:hypothetical protein
LSSLSEEATGRKLFRHAGATKLDIAFEDIEGLVPRMEMRRRSGSFSRFVDENLVTAGSAMVGEYKDAFSEHLATGAGGGIGDDHVRGQGFLLWH